MLQNIGKVILASTGVTLYCYDHLNKIKHYVKGQELVKPPHREEYPPSFEVPFREGFEKDCDANAEKLEASIKGLGESPLEDEKTFKGKLGKAKTSSQINGVGALKEKYGRTSIGNWKDGQLDGYVKIVTPGYRKEKVEKCFFENGVKKYFISYTEDGTRCEGTEDCYACVRANGSVYSEQIDKTNSVSKYFEYDDQFRLKVERTLSLPEKIGKGRQFLPNGQYYIGEMGESGPQGKGVTYDQFGDSLFEGVSPKGRFQENVDASRLLRTFITLACFIGSYIL